LDVEEHSDHPAMTDAVPAERLNGGMAGANGTANCREATS
jgi:hypothetical protein